VKTRKVSLEKIVEFGEKISIRSVRAAVIVDYKLVVIWIFGRSIVWRTPGDVFEGMRVLIRVLGTFIGMS